MTEIRSRVMKFVQLSEKTKICSDILQPVCVVQSRVLWAKWTFLRPWFCFIPLATTHNATQIVLTHSVWVHIFCQCLSACVWVCACRFPGTCSHHKWNPNLVFEKVLWKAILPLKSCIALRCWRLACTHFLSLSSFVLDVTVKSLCLLYPNIHQGHNPHR